MTYYTTYLRDVTGNNYLGLNIPEGIVDPFLNELKEILGDDFDEYCKYQQDRDHGSYHMTIINVMDYNMLSKKFGIDKFVNSLDNIFKYEIDDVKMMGIGTAERNGNRTYFIVCQSEQLDAIRSRYDLPKHDFHVTIGFKFKDVFGVPKNQVVSKRSKFLKLLSIEYYKKDNFDFVKRIRNFDLDKESEIVPISISDKYLKVKCDKYYMDIGMDDDNGGSLIMTKYMDDEYPRLSQTEISKILNKK